MPSTELRQSVLTAARQIVVKLGTQLLTDGRGRLDPAYIARIVKQIAELQQAGKQVTLVSSGAVGAGCGELNLDKRPTDVSQLQAVAAVGQRRLMTAFHDAFEKYDYEVAQLLLTRTDFDDRTRYLNFRNTITAAHQFGCIPIINENDSVSVDELRFGDNDMLAGLVCTALSADALVLLSVVDGLLDENGDVIDLVEDVKAVRKLSRKDKSSLGTGGMQTKLDAAQMATEGGEIAVIANGRMPNVLTKLLSGERAGTVFAPAKQKLTGKKRWIGHASRPAGRVCIDEGAARAVLQRGKSLLAAGITQVQGKFDRGAVLSVLDSEGNEIARGLSNYSAEELNLIKGKRSNQLGNILNREAYAEVIHRDNMVVS